MTAVDLGTAGKDNDYGAGRLDCYEAIQGTPAGIKDDNDTWESLSGKWELILQPNPFTAVTSIKLLGTSRNEKANIAIYDASGRVVRYLSLDACTSQPATEVMWDGRDEAGEMVRPGIYFVQVELGEDREVGKVILLD
jgi:hypothetical protein